MKIAVPCLLAALLVASCKSSKPVTHYSGDISLYKNASIAWSQLNSNQQPVQSPLFFYEAGDSIIKQEINRQLLLKGFKIEREEKKLFVNYCILEEEKLAPVSMTYKERYGKNALHANDYPDSSRDWLFMLKWKTLIVDLMDVKTNQLIWRGWVTNTESNSTKKQNDVIKETVEEIFKQFPSSLK